MGVISVAHNANFYNGNMNTNNKNNTNNNHVRLVKSYVYMISFGRIYAAYLDCNKKKSTKTSALQFGYAEMILNLQDIVDDINSRNYKHSPSSCFVIAYPTSREIYAAQFRDRIVQHFYIQEIEPILERILLPNTTSCRKGKGVDYALNLVKENVQKASKYGTREAFYLKIDLAGYFMSIQRERLTKAFTELINEKYHGEYKEELLYLTPIIFLNNPAANRILKCTVEQLMSVPERKRMKLHSGNGLAIGNITAQIGSNLNLNGLDHYIVKNLGFKYYARYVDDITIIDVSKEKLIKALPLIMNKLSETGQSISEKKTRIDTVYHGVPFLGKITYPYGYQRATKAAAGRVMKAAKETKIDEGLLSRLNSYTGRLKHYACYGLLQDYLKALPIQIWDYVVYDEANYKFKELNNYGTYGTVIRYDDPNREQLVKEAYAFLETHDDAQVVDNNITVTINQISEEEVLERLRSRREHECFPYINRGDLWYRTLTESQKSELDTWYKAWLDITKTKVVPAKPSWLE